MVSEASVADRRQGVIDGTAKPVEQIHHMVYEISVRQCAQESLVKTHEAKCPQILSGGDTIPSHPIHDLGRVKFPRG